MTIDSEVRLNNGVMMPRLGLGTYRIDWKAEDAVRWALETGYRLIDTASMYQNEVSVGIAIKSSGIPREDIFVTTKLNNPEHHDPEAALNGSLERLGLDYVDLYLIHWPVPEVRLRTWEFMEKFLEEGKCHSIGVSNYTQRHLDELLAVAKVVPAVNQVEFSPFLYQRELLEYCQSKGIALEAYSPLTEGYKLKDANLVEIGKRYKKSSVQVLIRWALQHGLIVIPGSKSEEHIEENAQIFDFQIADDDMQLLNSLNRDYRTCWDPTDAP